MKLTRLGRALARDIVRAAEAGADHDPGERTVVRAVNRGRRSSVTASSRRTVVRRTRRGRA